MNNKLYVLLTSCLLLFYSSTSAQIYVLDSTHTSIFNSVSINWEPLEKEVFFNNSRHLPDSVIRKNWDGSKYVNARFYAYSYDLNYNLSYRFRQDWSFVTQSWIKKYQYFNTFVGNLRTMNIREDWQATPNVWQQSIRYTYTYDSVGDLKERLRFTWDLNTNNWVNNRKYVYTIDTTGFRTQNTRYNWSSASLAWILHSKYEYSNDPRGLLQLRTRSIWDSNTSSWILDSKVEYAYDLTDNLVEEITSLWQISSNSWSLSSKKTYFRTAKQVLPVEFLSFEAKVYNNTVSLNWATAQEINNQGFEIQRSGDKNNWEKLGWQKPLNYGEIKAYTFFDLSPKEGENYYRIKQLDMDGAYSFSNIISVSLGQDFEVMRIYPNPTQNMVNIHCKETSQPEILRLYDLNGKLLKEWTYENSQLDLSRYERGIYIINVLFRGGIFKSKQIHKLN